MSAMARRHRSERLRLLGLQRAVRFTMAASPAKSPAIKAGTTPKVKA